MAKTAEARRRGRGSTPAGGSTPPLRSKRFRVVMRIFRTEGNGTPHIRGMVGRTLCGDVVDPGDMHALELLEVRVRDVCPQCLVQHLVRRESR